MAEAVEDHEGGFLGLPQQGGGREKGSVGWRRVRCKTQGQERSLSVDVARILPPPYTTHSTFTAHTHNAHNTHTEYIHSIYIQHTHALTTHTTHTYTLSTHTHTQNERERTCIHSRNSAWTLGSPLGLWWWLVRTRKQMHPHSPGFTATVCFRCRTIYNLRILPASLSSMGIVPSAYTCPPTLRPNQIFTQWIPTILQPRHHPSTQASFRNPIRPSTQCNLDKASAARRLTS